MGILEKIINFNGDEKTLAVRKVCGGVEFAKWKGRLEKVIKFHGEKKTPPLSRDSRGSEGF